MVRHLASNGKRVPPALVQSAAGLEAALNAGQPVDLGAAATTHERLARLVSPARPGALYLLDSTYHAPERFRILGPIPLVRQITVFAAACVVAFVGFSIHGIVTPASELQPKAFDTVLHNLHWLSAAGVGASFAMLFQVNEYITNRTYDPEHAPSYLTKLFLGVVAGFILVAMIPVPAMDAAEAKALARPTIALLGGFSAQAVYRILNRLVETLENLFSGGAKEVAAAREQAAAARANDEAAQHRMAVAGRLVRLQSSVTDPAVAAQMRDLIQSLTPEATASDPQSAPDAASTEAGRADGATAAMDSAGAPATAAPAAQPDAIPADAILATGIPSAPLVVEMDDDAADASPAVTGDESPGGKTGP